jgi:glycosidase
MPNNSHQANSQKQNKIPVKKIEPDNWWVNMENPHLQLMVYGEDISSFQIQLEYRGVSIKKIHQVENPNYLFIDLTILPSARSGIIPIHFFKDDKLIYTHSYKLLPREENSAKRKGFDSGDAIYLIMPDRFSNGNTDNNNLVEMLEKNNRRKEYGRHGGDLKGIYNHLDYIEEMGYTAIWLNPVLESNQPKASYHGYAITDFYRIDPRLGSNKAFKALVDECTKRGIKMIMDMVFNHCGNKHWWMKDLPMRDWINHWENFTRSNYRLSTISDPYVSQHDKNLSVKGWFDTHMPDLNLENIFMLTYLIQNSIWWIEYAGLKGIRMDTYPYPDKNSMAIWAQRIMLEYPDFNIVGEAWISEASKLCYWQKDFPNKDGFNSHLPTLMDFPMQKAISMAFNEEEGWDTGLARLYNTLADDHLYPHPLNLMIFPDNHDTGRIYHFLGEDINKLKMALTYVATTRGILQIYYGTELLMSGNGLDGHAHIRQDFPGGWPNDQTNAFSREGRNVEQNKVFKYIKTLLNYRKQSVALKYGQTMHFIPENGIYVYFRYTVEQCIMIILNNNKHGKKINTTAFNEILHKYSRGKNIITRRTIKDLQLIKIKAKSAMLIELI